MWLLPYLYNSENVHVEGIPLIPELKVMLSLITMKASFGGKSTLLFQLH